MLMLQPTKQYKKDRKLALKRGLPMNELDTVIETVDKGNLLLVATCIGSHSDLFQLCCGQLSRGRFVNRAPPFIGVLYTTCYRSYAHEIIENDLYIIIIGGLVSPKHHFADFNVTIPVDNLDEIYTE